MLALHEQLGLGGGAQGEPFYPGTVISERVRIWFGIWTMLAIRDARGRSLAGQGLSARWRRFRV